MALISYAQCDFCDTKEIIGRLTEDLKNLPDNWLFLTMEAKDTHNRYLLCPVHTAVILKYIGKIVNKD